MNIKQKPLVKVRPFSVRFRVTARKCGLKGDMLHNMCAKYLKNRCNPCLSQLLNNFLPSSAYDTIVEHATQF